MDDLIFKYLKFDYVVLIAAVGVLIFLLCFCFFIKRKLISRNLDAKYVELYTKRVTFLNAAIIWLTIHYYLAIAAVVCTINVIYINQMPDNNGAQKIVLYSVLSILFTLGDLIIRPAKAANKYREAYMIVDELIHKMEFNSSEEDDINSEDSPSTNAEASRTSFPVSDEIASVFKECEEKIFDGHS